MQAVSPRRRRRRLDEYEVSWLSSLFPPTETKERACHRSLGSDPRSSYNRNEMSTDRKPSANRNAASPSQSGLDRDPNAEALTRPGPRPAVTVMPVMTALP